MQYFYDGQIRRYLVQVIRLLSNFVVKYSDGTLVQVPVVYGDPDRQAASILGQNSQNVVQAAPRIGVYITDLDLDNTRLGDPSFVGKMNFRERGYDDESDRYLNTQGENYTVERAMPTPFTLTFKVDIWSSSTDQKLQIMEQILMLFNPSLEIQTTDNYVDWTSLTVVNLTDVTFSSRAIPVGTATEIDIATLNLTTPIYISPPAKIKRLGITTSIVANILGSINNADDGFIPGYGSDNNVVNAGPSVEGPLFTNNATVGNYDIEIVEGVIRLIDTGNQYISWNIILSHNPGVYKPGLTKIYLLQPDGSYIVGYVTVNTLDNTIMVVNWDTDTYPSNTGIPSTYRTSTGTFDAIIDPQKTGPGHGLPAAVVGSRYLILEDIGGGIRETIVAETRAQRINTDMLESKVNDHKVFVNDVEVGSGSQRVQDGNYFIILDVAAPIGSYITYELYLNEDGPDAWKNLDGSDFIAEANDVIEWNGSAWKAVFRSRENKDNLIYLTNIYTGTQYKWNGVSWSKTFEGGYKKGGWRLAL